MSQELTDLQINYLRIAAANNDNGTVYIHDFTSSYWLVEGGYMIAGDEPYAFVITDLGRNALFEELESSQSDSSETLFQWNLSYRVTIPRSGEWSIMVNHTITVYAATEWEARSLGGVDINIVFPYATEFVLTKIWRMISPDANMPEDLEYTLSSSSSSSESSLSSSSSDSSSSSILN